MIAGVHRQLPNHQAPPLTLRCHGQFQLEPRREGLDRIQTTAAVNSHLSFNYCPLDLLAKGDPGYLSILKSFLTSPKNTISL